MELGRKYDRSSVPKWWFCWTDPDGSLGGIVIVHAPNFQSALINASIPFPVDLSNVEILQFWEPVPEDWMYRWITPEELGVFPPFGGYI